ncbi:MAG: alpha-galactosidase [Lachnospiraceae bacterium]
MIRRLGETRPVFVLDTAKTTYCFRVMETGHLEHLYYGRRITIEDMPETLVEKYAFVPGNTNPYDKEHPGVTLENVRLEVSSYGRGDIREPFVEVVHADGSYSSDFVFVSAEAGSTGGTEQEVRQLPGSYDEQNEVEELCIVLKDGQYGLTLKLFYRVFEDCDVITRRAVLLNESEESVRLTRLMSTQLDFDTAEYVFTRFTGAWAREMRRTDTPAQAGKQVNAAYAGVSSNRANPFVMLSRAGTTEDSGDCYGINLIYSGNHYEAVEVNSYGKTRLVAGINPQSFCWQLAPGESFEAPEAVMAYSHLGFNGMSRCMHRFVREHIVRGFWKKKLRPVLLNSWEAAYFDFNEAKLLRLAKEAKDVGIELFVLDDGWFGKRDNDTCSLGDWEVNTKKLPNGIDGLCRKIKAMGLEFGLWVEPEMVNTDSDLYRAHPDWTLAIPDKPHSEGRNQRVLDLTRTEVQDFIIEKMSEVFSSADISYVKWDMNRILTDYFSQALPAERQGEVAHRYVLGLYRCMRELTARFPKILFEGCASGGNRFDLGILCYFPQIWASDDTDALCRAEMQTNYSYGYPLSVVGAHVSACPNHQTLRVTPLETRFAVAAFGVFGYECNLCDMKKEELDAIRVQTELYKSWREVLQTGTFYRGRSAFFPSEGRFSALSDTADNYIEWTCVSEDKERAVGMLMHRLAVPNTQLSCYYPKGLNEEYRYRFTNRELKYNIKNFGDLVNMVSPVHLKQDSLMHNVVAKFIKMDGETEDYTAGGDTLMYGGIHLKQAFGGTGYNSEVRFFPDFGARMYFMENSNER